MRINPGRISGEIDAPPSKSMMQRAIAIAALAEGSTIITNPSFCDDSLAAMGIADTLGATVERREDEVRIDGIASKSVGGVWNCNESGLCMRMFSPIAALFEKDITLTGTGSLNTRPVGMIEKLAELGALVKTTNGKPPVTIKGPIKGGRVRVDGSVSSQFVSGLVIALPLCENDSEIELVNLKSKDYVTMTESMVFLFGARVSIDNHMEIMRVNGNQRYYGREIGIDGDWSGAAFMLVAGAIAGEVNINKLGSSIQPDQAIKSVLLDAGAEIVFGGEEIFVSQSELTAFEFDATNSPDLFPPLVALACNCKGKSTILGVDRLMHKESNRAAALLDEFGKIGARIKIEGDKMEIEGCKLKGGVVNSHGDHRIAMACAIAALTSENGVEIREHECVSKSYPGFFHDLENLVGRGGEQK